MLRRPPPSPLFLYTTLFRSPSATSSCGTLNSSRRTASPFTPSRRMRSEEHTSELQSRVDLVCRLLLEKKKIGSIALVDMKYGPWSLAVRAFGVGSAQRSVAG